MKTLYAIPALIVAAVTVRADPPPLVVADVRGVAGDPIPVRALTEGKVVRWMSGTKGLTILPLELKDPKAVYVIARKPGVYVLYAVTAVGDEPSDIVAVKVTATLDDDPPSPPPGPPKPPDPPKPPVPDDPVLAKIRSQWPGKPTDGERLAAVKLQGAYTELAIAVKDKSFGLVGDFLAAYRVVADKTAAGDLILGCRNAARDLVYDFFAKDTETALDLATRGKASDLLGKIAAAFGSLK